MRHLLYRTLAIALFIALSMGTASAKRIVLPKIYMFGFAASFNDTIVHFTNVMEVDSAWVVKKSNFLLGRTLYSRQLRNYLAKEKDLPQRTCIVMYAKTKEKAEKQLIKLRKLYTEDKRNKGHFDVRYINDGEFHFETVDMSEVEYVDDNDKVKVSVELPNPVDIATGVAKKAIKKAAKKESKKRAEAEKRREKAGKQQ